MLYYAGTGNVSASNLDFIDHYNSVNNPKGTFLIASTPDCQPNDDRIKTVDIHNATYSLPVNPDSSKFTSLALIYNENLYRTIKTTVSDQTFKDIENNGSILLMSYGGAGGNDEFTLTNLLVNNAAAVMSQFHFALFRKVTISGVNITHSPSTYDVPVILPEYNGYVHISDVSITDVNGTDSFANAVIQFNNLPVTYTYVSNICVQNSYLRFRRLIRSLSTLNTFIFENSVFTNIYQSTDGAIISTGRIKQAILTNHTFSGIKSLELSDESSRIIHIDVLDLNSTLNTTLKNIHVTDSDTSLVSFGSILNSPPDAKLFLISNITYKDSTFASPKSIINTAGIELDANVEFILQDLKFSNIEYLTKGNLLQLMHQLSSQVLISNSSFSNMTAGKLLVESSNKQNANLQTRVRIQNTVFDSLMEKYNSFVNINEGGNLEIHNCTFSNIMSYEEGAVLYAGSRSTQTVITDSTFFNNSASIASVFYIESQSVVECHR